MQLLGDDGSFGVDGLDDGWGEESEALDGDIVEEEDECGTESRWVDDTPQCLLAVDLVEDFGCCDTLRFDTRNGEVALFLREPPCSRRAVCEGDECDYREAASDDTLDSEDLLSVRGLAHTCNLLARLTILHVCRLPK